MKERAKKKMRQRSNEKFINSKNPHAEPEPWGLMLGAGGEESLLGGEKKKIRGLVKVGGHQGTWSRKENARRVGRTSGQKKRGGTSFKRVRRKQLRSGRFGGGD